MIGVMRKVSGFGVALAAACGCGVWCGCAASGSGVPITFEQEEWYYAGHEGYKLTTEHYEIHTTITDDNLVNTFPRLVETAFAQYTSLAPPAVPTQARMPMYLFATRGQWADFTKRTFPPQRAKALLRIRNGGYSEKGLSATQYVTHATTFPLLAHEGFHQYLHVYVGQRVPAWLNEGLAVCCEGQRWRGNQNVDFEPWNNPLRRNKLAERLIQGRTVALRELLRTHPGLVISGPPSKVAAYYSQVWALIWFLKEGQDGKYAEGLDRLIAALSDPDVERYAKAAFISAEADEYHYGEYLFRHFISDDLNTIEREYVAFMRERVLGER